MMLPIVMEFNAECTGEKFKAVAEALGVRSEEHTSELQSHRFISMPYH